MKKRLPFVAGIFCLLLSTVSAFSADLGSGGTAAPTRLVGDSCIIDTVKKSSGNRFGAASIKPIAGATDPAGVTGNNWADYSVIKNKLRDIKFGGYYRFLGFYRYMPAPFGQTDYRRTLGVGDGYREPVLSFSVNATPAPGVAIGTDIFWAPGYGGPKIKDYDNLSLYLGINFYSSIKTKYADINLRAGGIHWYHLSPFTLWNNRGYNRFSTFERNPWEPVLAAGDRYNRYWEREALKQDIRWDNQAFQGIILEGLRMPYGLNAFFLLGKTQNNGGGAAYSLGKIPNSSIGGRLEKPFGSNIISYNHFTSTTYLDSLSPKYNRYSVNSLEFGVLQKGIHITGEAGIGSFETPVYAKNYGPAIMGRLQLPSSVTYFPIDISAYHVDKNFVNVNSTFINTSKQQVTSTLLPFSSPLVDIGSMANNRQGAAVNSELQFGPLVINLGIAASAEIDQLNRQITYYHRVNNVSWSRFSLYNSGIGPYQRVNGLFRNVTETVNINGSGDLPSKHFNNFEMHLKFKEKLAGRDITFFWFSSNASVSPKMSVIPVTSTDAWIRTYTNEFDLNYTVTKNVVLIGYYGIERVLGNKDTDLDVKTGLPRNQTGHGYGLGADINISERAGLYFRQRWYNFTDANFELDYFRGHESSVELKIFF